MYVFDWRDKVSRRGRYGFFPTTYLMDWVSPVLPFLWALRKYKQQRLIDRKTATHHPNSGVWRPELRDLIARGFLVGCKLGSPDTLQPWCGVCAHAELYPRTYAGTYLECGHDTVDIKRTWSHIVSASTHWLQMQGN